jgi:hypothetical protein
MSVVEKKNAIIVEIKTSSNPMTPWSMVHVPIPIFPFPPLHLLDKERGCPLLLKL